MINDTDDIKVSVCVVTYNQEKYIAECLDSLVSQETDFKFEIIVGEDCSTDGTRAIVQQYVDKYPDIVKPVFHEQNVGAVENIKQVYLAAKGKYIAHMDGDDMGLPGKLQKQFDILENNSDCAICVHNMNAIDSHGNTMNAAFKTFAERKYSLLDMYLINPFFIHSSKMFVNRIEEYIDNLDVNALDTEVHIEQAKQGDIFFLDERLGCYRQFVGVTYEKNFVSELVRERIQFIYDNVDTNLFSSSQLEEIKNKYARVLLEYAYQCSISIKDKSLFKKYVLKSLKVKNLGITSYVFKISLMSPKLFFRVSEFRKLLRNRSNK